MPTEELEANKKFFLLRPLGSRSGRGAMKRGDYVESMSQAIQCIKEDQQHLFHLINNQTFLMDATVNMIRRDHASLDKQLSEWEAYINKTITNIYSIHEKEFREHLANTLPSSIAQVLLVVSRLQRVQGVILDILVETHHGKINPLLIAHDAVEFRLENFFILNQKNYL
ncbi:unnamed protein product [Hermetia illucens]|uniref:Uncharacterized protein n=1 Tax=Hermetia illucens TaxID=343691 RepID=A0A7R8YVX5_HERIL|nr:unnamed protein product [Hermetia illucens]